jgi:hypothetical protein
MTSSEVTDERHPYEHDPLDYTPLPDVCWDCRHEAGEYKNYTLKSGAAMEIFSGYACHHPALLTNLKAQAKIRLAGCCSRFEQGAAEC